MTFIDPYAHIKKDPEREVEKNPNYNEFVDLVLNRIRFAPGRESINIHSQKKCCDSYGVILYHQAADGDIEYLCAKKKDTIEYYIFITGRYNDKQLWTIFNLMTHKERERLLTHIDDFRLLWDDLWVNHNSKWYIEEYPRAEKIFNQIKPFIPKLVQLSYSNVNDTEWVWPKGQKNREEYRDYERGELRAAVREFYEETRIHLQVDMTKRYRTITETYRGSNNFIYNTKYFVIPVASRLIPPAPIKKEKGLRKECISYDFEKLGWFTVVNVPVNDRRKKELIKIDKQLKSEIYK